jgi:hypothetical protein
MPPKDILDIIANHGGGQLRELLTERLAEITEKVEETGGDGKLTLVLKLEKKGGVALLTPEIKSARPEPALSAAMYDFGPGGELSPPNSRQSDLPIEGTPRKKVLAFDGGKKPGDKDGN